MADEDHKETPVEAPVKEPAEKVAEKADDAADKVIPEPVAEVTEHPEDEIPPWGKDLTDKVDTLMEQIAAIGTGEASVVEEATDDVPSDGHEVGDESPTKKPWTHRGFFA